MAMGTGAGRVEKTNKGFVFIQEASVDTPWTEGYFCAQINSLILLILFRWNFPKLY
jgi:hypothetical protein